MCFTPYLDFDFISFLLGYLPLVPLLILKFFGFFSGFILFYFFILFILFFSFFTRVFFLCFYAKGSSHPPPPPPPAKCSVKIRMELPSPHGKHVTAFHRQAFPRANEWFFHHLFSTTGVVVPSEIIPFTNVDLSKRGTLVSKGIFRLRSHALKIGGVSQRNRRLIRKESTRQVPTTASFNGLRQCAYKTAILANV